MKYMMLVYTDEQAWREDQLEACYAESAQYTHQLKAKGHYLGASPLQPTSTATSVRVRNGKPLVTDGPFAEMREQLGGYFLVEAKDLDEAISIAGGIPGARMGTVEIRPIREISGLPAAECLTPVRELRRRAKAGPGCRRCSMSRSPVASGR